MSLICLHNYLANTDTTKQTNGTYWLAIVRAVKYRACKEQYLQLFSYCGLGACFIQHMMVFVIHGFYEGYKVRWQRLVQISNLMTLTYTCFAEKGFLHV